MVSSLYFFLISQPRKDLVLNLKLQHGQYGFSFQFMYISHILHLFWPCLYLDGISWFLLALYLVHIPLQLNCYISGELILIGNKYFITFLDWSAYSILYWKKTRWQNKCIFQRNSLLRFQVEDNPIWEVIRYQCYGVQRPSSCFDVYQYLKVVVHAKLVTLLQ